MSEFINNQERRREGLLKFSMGIMEGKDGKQLIDKYKEAIEHVTPYDILAMEDKQVRMGVSPSKIKKHIEKILNVIGPHLKKYKWDHPERGHPLYYMMEENRHLENLLDEMKGPIKKIELSKEGEVDKKAEMRKLEEYLKRVMEFEKHYLRKENILFPYLEKKWDYYRPVQVMWSLHDDIRGHWKSIAKLLAENDDFNDQLRKQFGELFLWMYRMVFKEEWIMFPVANETLSSAEWQEIQQHSHEIGYVYIQPPGEDEMVSSTEKEIGTTGLEDIDLEDEKLGLGQVLLGMGTGVLNMEQLILMLNNLPIDVTYVDENNRVRYFSNPKDRIFPRSPAIIGRSVQNCHPPESVHIVNQIVEAFKKGEKDNADFWIKLKGRYIMIRYFALRNSKGEYRGTLEVSQDITEIKELEGEKRLLDWEE